MSTATKPKSQTELRRLARCLNAIAGGFVHNGKHYSTARFSRGQLQARNVTGERWTSITADCRDDRGNQISATTAKATAKAKVLAEYPNACCTWNASQMGYRIIGNNTVIGLGPSAPAAWRDAAAQMET